jgi:hypothetical protein
MAKGGELEKLVRTHGNKADDSEADEGSNEPNGKPTTNKDKPNSEGKTNTTKRMHPPFYVYF